MANAKEVRHKSREDSVNETPALTAEMMARYQRQMVLPQVGIEGQRRLLASRVLVVGVGALGSAAAIYLAVAGVGTLGLVDGDTVDRSNLHRQILHDESQLGILKTRSGARRLRALNPDSHIQEHPEFLSAENILDLFARYDLIVNGSDNFPTRYLVNDAAVLLQKPLVDAALLRFEGQLAVFRPGFGCYRCLFPVPPPPGTVPDCSEAGIFGAVAGVLGSMEAVEALKVLLEIGQSTPGKLLLYDALTGTWHGVPFHRDVNCAVCGDHPGITRLMDYEDFCGTPLPSRTLQTIHCDSGHGIAMDGEQATRLLENKTVTIVDIRSVVEFQKGHLPSARQCALEDLEQLVVVVDKKTPILVICAMGVRSAYAAQYLRSGGYQAWSLAGGTTAWINAGRPWDQPESRTPAMPPK